MPEDEGEDVSEVALHSYRPFSLLGALDQTVQHHLRGLMREVLL